MSEGEICQSSIVQLGWNSCQATTSKVKLAAWQCDQTIYSKGQKLQGAVQKYFGQYILNCSTKTLFALHPGNTTHTLVRQLLSLEVWEEHQHQTSPVNIFHRLCFVWKTTNSVRMKPSCGRKCEPTSGEKSSNQFTQPWWPDGKVEYALWYEDETFGLCDYTSCIKWCYTSHLRKYNCWLSCFSDDKRQKLIKTIKGRMEFDVPISNLFTWEPLMELYRSQEPTVD